MRYNEICRQIADYVRKRYPAKEYELYRIVLICDLIDIALKYEHMQGRLLNIKTWEEVKASDSQRSPK